LNQRVKKTVNNVVTTSFFTSNWQELESKTGRETTVYVWGTRYIDDLIFRDKGSKRLYSLADPNWNVIATVNSSGTVQERMRYDVFGKVTWLDAAFGSKAVSGFAWSRTFTGQVLDAEAGLMLYRMRHYHTGLGRFVQRDPIGYEAGDVSLYRHVGIMPFVFADVFCLQKTGQERCDEWLAANPASPMHNNLGFVTYPFSSGHFFCW
jgi:RHS repeat-associated protein